jgi:ATP-dependent helicase/nuclease subunit A
MNLQIISAGAGSGKTYTLTELIHKLVVSGEVRPEAIIATTFTQKAASELRERVKLKFLEEGMMEASEAVDQALIGTVHSIGTRILQRFAFEQGYSPLVEIMPEGEAQNIFNMSISRILTIEVTEKLQTLTRQLSFVPPQDESHFDWRNQLKSLADLMRTNHLDQTGRQRSRDASWQRIESMLYSTDDALLPKHADAWLSRLAALLSTTVETIEAKGEDTTVKTLTAIESCRSALFTIKHTGTLPWADWAKLGKASFAKKSEEDATALVAYCKQVEAHPTLRAELKAYLDIMFDLAEQSIDEFQEYKKKRGVIDYSDMEVMLDEALNHAHIRQELGAEADLLMVDEFQDTSPLQLSIFLKLSQIAKKSYWVGDPKQSIYGFRGAEPALMQAVVAATGGIKKENILPISYRSRPDLVHACNAIFKRAFTDLPEEQIVLKAGRKEPENAPEKWSKALIQWHLLNADDENKKAPNKTWTQRAIAQQVADTLRSGLLVQSKSTKQLRTIQPGDVAILCRTNKECTEMANALHEAGLSVTISQTGLHGTTEGKLLLAALRFLVDKSDSLSISEILRLTKEMDLPELIAHRSTYLTTPAEQQKTRWAREVGLIGQLDEMRRRIRDLSAVEVLELLLVETDLAQYLPSFGDMEHRHANLEQMRASAAEYELACTRLHMASSLPGWLLWLDKQARAKKDNQNSTQNQQAVNVLSYHKSKGLEYPFVVCYGLESKLKERFWGLAVMQEHTEHDLNHILRGRYVEFRIHPFGKQIAKTHIADQVEASEVYQKETEASRQEETRLLYVGLTRARDYLAFPTSVAPTAWLNRTFNKDDDAITLQPDSTETPFYDPGHGAEPLHLDLQKARFASDFVPTQPNTRQAERWLEQPQGLVEHPPRIIHVQNEQVFDMRLRQILPQHSAHHLPNTADWTSDDEAAFRGFFYADHPLRAHHDRLLIAETQLRIHQKATAQPEDLLDVSDALHLSLGVKQVTGSLYRNLMLQERSLEVQVPLTYTTSNNQPTLCIFFDSLQDKRQVSQSSVENQLLWAMYALQESEQVKVEGVMVSLQGIWRYKM